MVRSGSKPRAADPGIRSRGKVGGRRRGAQLASGECSHGRQLQSRRVSAGLTRAPRTGSATSSSPWPPLLGHLVRGLRERFELARDAGVGLRRGCRSADRNGASRYARRRTRLLCSAQLTGGPAPVPFCCRRRRRERRDPVCDSPPSRQLGTHEARGEGGGGTLGPTSDPHPKGAAPRASNALRPVRCGR